MFQAGETVLDRTGRQKGKGGFGHRDQRGAAAAARVYGGPLTCCWRAPTPSG